MDSNDQNADECQADRIARNSMEPQSARGDTGSVEMHSIPDQIAADRYRRSNKAAMKGLGVRFFRLRRPSPSGVNFCDR